jgi:hypothetical protein
MIVQDGLWLSHLVFVDGLLEATELHRAHGDALVAVSLVSDVIERYQRYQWHGPMASYGTMVCIDV